MKRTHLIAATALALSAPAVPHAHAAEIAVGTPGQFLDTRHHVVVMNGSEADARLGYAKIVCRARFGIEADAPVIPPGFGACLKSQGFVWISDSPTQIATREKAKQDARMRAQLHDVSDALIQAGAAMQPHGCTGQVQANGYFSTQCY